jgi:hypothetical protein
VESKSIKGSVVITGGNLTNANVAAGNGNQQIQSANAASPTTKVLDLLGQLKQLLATDATPDQQGALLALRELEEDAPEPSRHYRLAGALGRLKDTIGSGTAFVVPFAELAAAIAELLRAKP